MRSFLSLTFLFLVSSLPAQDRYILYFKIKDSRAPFSLSQQSIEKRMKAGITLGESDIPVSSASIQELASKGIRVIHASRWLNAVLAEIYGPADLSAFPFVSAFEKIAYHAPEPSAAAIALHHLADSSYRNFALNDGLALPSHGYKARGMQIAVFDSGFEGVDRVDGFAKLRDEGRILSAWNLVNGSNVYAESQHGTLVLSTMAGYIEGRYTGTAVEAGYHLFVTEDASSESRSEEFNWVVAAEKADSIGVDVINSSLSYTRFDDPYTSYTQKDMDGKTTLVSFGARMAASKGILVVCSAGNYAEDEWGTIGSPADTDSILTVGAVNMEGMAAAFSSPGPSADGRLKPEVCALGVQTALIDKQGTIIHGSGTSFAAPIITGLATSLWQPLTGYHAQDIISLLERCAHHFANPDYKCGYGLPNFYKAMIVTQLLPEPGNFRLFPNPASHTLSLSPGFLWGDLNAKLVNSLGQLVRSAEIKGASKYDNIDLSFMLTPALPEGVYFLRIGVGHAQTTRKLVISH